MAVEILESTIVALALAFVAIVLLRIVIPHLYEQDRRLAQFLYLDLFWVALFFAVYIYEKRTISSIGVVLGDNLLLTLEYSVICVLVTLLLFVISARRARAKGFLRIDREKGLLVLGNEGIDLGFISLPGYIQIFLMQIIWVALPIELFFRGYLISRIAESFTDFAGVLISALVYFVTYMDKPIYGNINALLALLWGYSYIQTGSILPGIIAHISINTFSYLLARNIALSGGN
ncbi:MAG: CPBP family intramembrane metalloprotease [Candidatus Methanofastidiosa archaeon]|nr:CPBP family intramembrane metalloprotease [Candidatus Methanofastidiosa archaeon]